MRNFFILEKENEQIKDRILRQIRFFFEHEEEENYYKPVRIFGVILIFNTKVTVTKTKHYLLKNILLKLDHT